MILPSNPQISVDSHYNETHKIHKVCNESNPGVLVKKKIQMSGKLVGEALQCSCVKILRSSCRKPGKQNSRHHEFLLGKDGRYTVQTVPCIRETG